MPKLERYLAQGAKEFRASVLNFYPTHVTFELGDLTRNGGWQYEEALAMISFVKTQKFKSYVKSLSNKRITYKPTESGVLLIPAKSNTRINFFTPSGDIIDYVLENTNLSRSGVQRGHTEITPNVALSVGYKIKNLGNDLGLDAAEQGKLNRLVKKLYSNAGINYKVIYRDNTSALKQSVQIAPHQAFRNVSRGSQEFQENEWFIRVLVDELSTKQSKFFRKLNQQIADKGLLTAAASKSFLERLKSTFIDLFYGRIFKRNFRKGTKSGTIDTKDLSRTKVDLNSHKNIPVQEGAGISLSIIPLINLRLHDRIKQLMGPGDDPEILNYQTGRFARSAEVVSLTQTRGIAVQFFYTYMRYPYDVFLPGGRLYKPGRDPRGIIGPAIRDIATQIIGDKFGITTKLQ